MASAAQYDVIIVGGGLSGLQSAVTAHQAGLSCLVLEANDRFGGKVLSVPVENIDGVTVDMGAAWINDTSQSKIFALAKKHGAEFQKQIDEGDNIIVSPDGQVIRQPRGALPAPPEDQERLGQLIGTIDELGLKVKEENFDGPVSKELDKLTFDDWVLQQAKGLTLAESLMTFATRAFVGCEPDKVSALFMIKYIHCGTGFSNLTSVGKNGGQYLRPKQGSKLYVESLLSELPKESTLHSKPVTSISQHDDYCTVTCSTGETFTAKKVIISAPTPLYKHITFNPPLPESKSNLSKSTFIGYYTKQVNSYSKPWWRELGLAGEVQSLSDKGPFNFVLDTSIPSQNQFSLSMFFVSEPGRKWSQLSATQRRQAACDHLQKLFGPSLKDDKIPEAQSWREFDWAKQAWFEGAPSSLYPVGTLTSDAGRALRERFGHVHFVGTEMSEVWEGYMEGALRDGERGGIEVVDELKGKSE